MDLKQRLALFLLRTKFTILTALSKQLAARKAFEFFCTPKLRLTKEAPEIFNRAEHITFEWEGHLIRGYRWNHSPKKVLILHGFESGIINFDRYIQPLINKGYEVLGFDAPAHGQSSGDSINVLLYKQLVEHIYRTYGPIRSFIAHSFGGLALTLALEDIPHDSDYKMVLVAPAVETATAASNFFQLLKLKPSLKPHFNKLIRELGKHEIEWFSVARASAAIKAQVLFLQDKQDTMTPYSDVVPIMNRNYPNFTFIITEGLGHRRIYRDDTIFNAILNFL